MAIFQTIFDRYLSGTDRIKFTAYFTPAQAMLIKVLADTSYSANVKVIVGAVGAAVISILLLAITKKPEALSKNVEQEAAAQAVSSANITANLASASAIKQGMAGTVSTAVDVAKQSVDVLAAIAKDTPDLSVTNLPTFAATQQKAADALAPLETTSADIAATDKPPAPPIVAPGASSQAVGSSTGGTLSLSDIINASKNG